MLIYQAVWDALGSESWAVSRHAAFSTSYRLLSSIAQNLGIEGAPQILDLAAELFAALGLGQLHVEVNAGGGGFTGEDLLLGSGFRERYGQRLAIRHRMDAFAAGYGAAATSVAFPSDWGTFEAEETSCVARGDAVCTFSLTRKPDPQRAGHAVTRHDANELVPEELDDEAMGSDPAARSAALDLLLGATSDDRGVVRLTPQNGASPVGSRLALLPVSYRGQLVFDALHLLERRSPALAPLFVALVREATQAAVYLAIAEIDRSPGLLRLDRPATSEERAVRYSAIASALGWGSFAVAEFIPERRLVLKSPVTPEAVYYTTCHGGAPGVELPGLQGVAGAIALLTHEASAHVASRDHHVPRFEEYPDVVRRGPDLRIEEARSIVRGDAECEIVVEMSRRGGLRA